MLQVQLEVGTDPKEVGRARRWARSRLVDLGMEPDESLSETLVLLVSELVTNAVVHTGRPAVLRMALSGCLVTGSGTVRIEVVDACAVPPRRCRADGDDTHGRGLELVGGLADRWGWRCEGSGKRVWCELDRGCGAASAGAGAGAGTGTGTAGEVESTASTASTEGFVEAPRDRPAVQPART
ncbi:ATP-binding protein [Streptomyces sp. TRM43335]|uniref:ATP-binding protein n=2 Tax=Streptomyces taklimakanensis TaxID=2569853 RepID=A0A6G2BBS9_9ACTN|nr:ATP-binding protein [Streptomyces taklimakanensis]MTE19529.1 ATP-binding protein [Streptomyces taklimakanensis]